MSFLSSQVLDYQVTKDKHGRRIAAYHIHFQGWNSSWDRIVEENYILKNTDENRALMKKLAETAKKYRKNKQRRKKIEEILNCYCHDKIPLQESDSDDSSSSQDSLDNDRDDEDDDKQSSGDESSNDTGSETRERRRATHVPVDIEIPDILKSRLEDDYIAINHADKVTKLPVSPTVIEVLEGFMKTFCVNLLCEPSEKEKENRRLNNNNHQEHTLLCPPGVSIALCKELVDGLRICFDFLFPVILIYSLERNQFEHMMSVMKPQEVRKEEDKSSDEPSSKKHKSSRQNKHSHSEDTENVEQSPRRVTRRSLNQEDSLPSPTPQTSPGKVERKKGRGRRSHASGSSQVIKTEPVSDSDVGGSDTGMKVNVPADSDSRDEVSDHGGCRKEDYLDNVLSWQLFPPEYRCQYAITPSQIYGVNHFLRLFVKLPEILNKMDMEDCKMRTLMKLVHHLLRYLVERQEDLFGELEYIDR